jgi:hypothetical protein
MRVIKCWSKLKIKKIKHQRSRKRKVDPTQLERADLEQYQLHTEDGVTGVPS